jgi:hypothetical protein
MTFFYLQMKKKSNAWTVFSYRSLYGLAQFSMQISDEQSYLGMHITLKDGAAVIDMSYYMDTLLEEFEEHKENLR